MHHHRQIGGALDSGYAKAPNRLGQAGLGLRHPVLNKLLGLIGVGDSQGHQAIGGGLAAHIEHPLDAVDLLFDRRRYCLSDNLRIGSRKLRAHNHRGRHDLGIFGDRHDRQREQPCHENQHRQDAGKDRPVDEEF